MSYRLPQDDLMLLSWNDLEGEEVNLSSSSSSGDDSSYVIEDFETGEGEKQPPPDEDQNNSDLDEPDMEQASSFIDDDQQSEDEVPSIGDDDVFEIDLADLPPDDPMDDRQSSDGSVDNEWSMLDGDDSSDSNSSDFVVPNMELPSIDNLENNVSFYDDRQPVFNDLNNNSIDQQRTDKTVRKGVDSLNLNETSPGKFIAIDRGPLDDHNSEIIDDTKETALRDESPFRDKSGNAYSVNPLFSEDQTTTNKDCQNSGPSSNYYENAEQPNSIEMEEHCFDSGNFQKINDFYDFFPMSRQNARKTSRLGCGGKRKQRRLRRY